MGGTFGTGYRVTLLLIVVLFAGWSCYPRRIGMLEQKVDEVAKAQAELKKKDASLEGQMEQLRKEVSGLVREVEAVASRWEVLVRGLEIPEEPGSVKPDETGDRRFSWTVPKELSSQQLLARARGQIVTGNYNRAIIDLEELKTLYPDSPQSEEAHYLIGESYYTQGDYFRSLETFSAFVQEYPDSRRLPAAILKAADSCAALGWKDKAQVLYDELIKNHEGTEESKLAAVKAAELGSGSR